MKLKDAIKYSDMVTDRVDLLTKNDKGKWFNSDGDHISDREIEITKKDDWFPLMEKPVFLDGQKVSILEAIFSGQIFKFNQDYFRCNGHTIERYETIGNWEPCSPDTFFVISENVYIVHEIPFEWKSVSFAEAVEYLQNHPDEYYGQVTIGQTILEVGICKNGELIDGMANSLFGSGRKATDIINGKWQIKIKYS